ncbi:PREDICTED: uncharacterized protein LOC108366941 [Rhagoletis zephyria]|uniref:uncharacterized protein LOC108366941 n=1 Tax=Rhagoletis zephyria TaxID=28612 RepID=UPI00081165CF|nr:PREDICTED: uncharacterized protein LOC108366941 [Rhagoletis zephyria]
MVRRRKPEEGHYIEKDYLTTYELNRALNILIRAVHVDFAHEMSCLENKHPLPKNSLRRFVSRRGADLYSDCGITLVGADKELQNYFKNQKAALTEHLAAALANEGTTWHFIPPASPHFGGLWEAGVKSTQHHLRHVMKDRTLTYEEMSTLLTQIENCQNARPLCPLTPR